MKDVISTQVPLNQPSDSPSPQHRSVPQPPKPPPAPSPPPQSRPLQNFPPRNSVQVLPPVASHPVRAADFEGMTPQEMARKELAKVIAALSNICVYGVKDSSRVAAAKVLCDVAIKAQYLPQNKDETKLDRTGQIPSNWRETLIGLAKAS